MENNKILVVDDDQNIVLIISMYLKKEGFDVITCQRGNLVMEAIHKEKPALVLLDVMLPGKDGFTVLQEIRAEGDLPVIMLTAKGSTDDRLQGFDTGADDYVSKPFEPKELIARIRAVLRRTATGTDTEEEAQKSVTIDGLSISIENYLVTVDGNVVEMTPKEIELLFFFATHETKVFTREQLLNEVWGFEITGDTRTVDVHVKRIREKIGATYAPIIHTVWGVGYKFDRNLKGK